MKFSACIQLSCYLPVNTFPSLSLSLPSRAERKVRPSAMY